MRRLLFIAHRVPYPPDKGERVRAFHELEALDEHFHVTLATLRHPGDDPDASEAARAWCDELLLAPAGGRTGLLRGGANLLTGRSVTEGYFASRQLRRHIRQAGRTAPFDLVLGYSSSTLPYVLSAPGAARAIDLVDVDSAKWDQYADTARPPLRWVYRTEARAVRRLEHRAVGRLDAVFLVSEAEAAVLACHGANVRAVGNGVDLEYFQPTDTPPAVDPTLVFTGTMNYRPNIEGICWFAENVWPGLRDRSPTLRLMIVGRDPAPAVRALADRPGVTVTGSVPDVRPYLSAAAVAICPLRIARGIQNKILEALAMGRSVVASPAAMEGIEAEPDRHALLAETPEQWQKQISRLIESPERRDRLGRAAREHVEQTYSWARQLRPLVRRCRELCGRTDAPAGAPAEPSPAAASSQ